MATISINLAMDLTPSPKQNALAEAIARASAPLVMPSLGIKPACHSLSIDNLPHYFVRLKAKGFGEGLKKALTRI